jgi:hypothetical protein
MKKLSIALFGSFTRPTFDKYSDKDILIVSDAIDLLNEQKHHYEKQGYSVSTYTYSKLSYLSKKKSLFIDHLIKECKIQRDDDGMLKKILSTHKTKDIFDNEKIEAVKYFTLLSKVPNTEKGLSWFCDCFYVGLRNYLIIKSAENRALTFSYLELINTLFQENLITSKELSVLKDLRVVKRNYRDNVTDEHPPVEYVNMLILIGAKLKLLKKASFSSKETFLANAMKKLGDCQYSNYSKLRIFEMIYFIRGHFDPFLEKIITNPQMYAFPFRNQAYIDSLLRSLKNEKGLSIKQKEMIIV